jgi:hypothetical protein
MRHSIALFCLLSISWTVQASDVPQNKATLKCMATTDVSALCARWVEADPQCPSGQRAWVKESCLEPKNLVSEIIQDQKPVTLQLEANLFKKFSTTKIAESLIYRRSQLYDQRDLTQPDYNIYRDSSLIIQIQSDNLSSILSKGFLNQFQTSTSGGLLRPDKRVTAEKALGGVSLPFDPQVQNFVNELRPKYAYLFFEKPKVGIADNWIDARYGNTFVKLKDHLKRRSTFSNGDSLDIITGNLGSRSKVLFFWATFYYSVPNLQLDRESYYEAQIWGPVKAEDIEYILVDCLKYNPPLFVANKIVETLNAAKSKVPAYSCIFDQSDGHFVMRPGKKLYPL